MAVIIIRSVEILDSNGNLLPYDSGLYGWQAAFNPKPFGNTGKLYLSVVCGIDTDMALQADFKLEMIYLSSYQFLMGNGSSVKYTRQVTPEISVTMPIDIKRLKPMGQGFNCDMRITVKDTVTPSPRSNPYLFTVIGR